jgi:hypothetical protein
LNRFLAVLSKQLQNVRRFGRSRHLEDPPLSREWWMLHFSEHLLPVRASPQLLPLPVFRHQNPLFFAVDAASAILSFTFWAVSVSVSPIPLVVLSAFVAIRILLFYSDPLCGRSL